MVYTKFPEGGGKQKYRQWLYGLSENGEPGKASVTASWQRPRTEETQRTEKTEQVACRAAPLQSQRSKCDCGWTASHRGSSGCCGLGWRAAGFCLLKNSEWFYNILDYFSNSTSFGFFSSSKTWLPYLKVSWSFPKRPWIFLLIKEPCTKIC